VLATSATLRYLPTYYTYTPHETIRVDIILLSLNSVYIIKRCLSMSL
jgi:hypothetical protein